MSSRLFFPDAPSAADTMTFAGRAARLGDGTVRLRAADGVLALSSAPLAPETLLDPTPTVLGMRFVTVDPELVCDLVVDASELRADADPHTLRLPETGRIATWAGVSPPRAGWTPVATLAAATLAARAQWGIATVAESVPSSAGEDIVRAVRSRVWGADDEELDGLTLGVAFAAFTLGFIGGEETVPVTRNGPWTRISLQRGHVLTRSTTRTGMTAVRTTRAG